MREKEWKSMSQNPNSELIVGGVPSKAWLAAAPRSWWVGPRSFQILALEQCVPTNRDPISTPTSVNNSFRTRISKLRIRISKGNAGTPMD
jgi:hypothetical protein